MSERRLKDTPSYAKSLIYFQCIYKYKKSKGWVLRKIKLPFHKVLKP
jgi:hypothetical protein